MNVITSYEETKYDENYKNAKCKLTEFLFALEELSSQQKIQLANDFINFAGMKVAINEFMNYIKAKKI